MEELLYAAHHALLDDLLFPEPEDESLWLDTAQPGDQPTVRDLWRTLLVEQNAGDLLPSQLEALDQCLDAPWFRLRLVRRIDGAVVGDSTDTCRSVRRACRSCRVLRRLRPS